MRIKLRADGTAQCLDLFYNRLGPQNRSGDQIRMSADIFGERIDRKIGAMIERLLVNWTEQGVIAGNDRTIPLLLFDFFRDTPDSCNIDNTVGRVGRRFDQDYRNTPLTDC